jgi:hypothetical protein
MFFSFTASFRLAKEIQLLRHYIKTNKAATNGSLTSLTPVFQTTNQVFSHRLSDFPLDMDSNEYG